MSKKRVLVTGGAGFIGSNFVNKFYNEHEIYIVDFLTYAGKKENINWSIVEKERFYQYNILWVSWLRSLFMEVKPDVVVNFAAETHVDNSIASPLAFTPTNINGTQNLLELSLEYGVEKFIQISTDEVYGHLGPNDPSFTELTPLSPRSPYSATKASADLIVQAYHETYGMHTCITRCSNNFGPNQHVEKLVPKIISNALQDKKIPIYGQGKNVRDWIYVEDHIDGINSVINHGKPGNIYNFGGNNSEIENIEMCKRILKILGKPEELIEYVEDRKGHDFRYSIDYKKAKNELGWEPKWDFSDALLKTINFYKEKYLA